jgi:hypothetical protein
MMRVDEHFEAALDPRWNIMETGNAKVAHEDEGMAHHASTRLTLTVLPTNKGYSNAQLDDYTPNALRNKLAFQWRPPLKMSVRARASGELRGTAGFGFWNHPFAPGERGFRLPQSVWFFFGSPPSNMALAKGVPGHGWKAATFDAKRWQFLALLPTAPIGMLLMRVHLFYHLLWSIGQRAIGVSEKLLDSVLLSEWHTYTLEWRTDGATFAVDGKVVHEAPYAPRAALGFVAWLDNQYAVVTPQGQFGFGVLPVESSQSLMLEHIRIETV